MGMKVEVKTCIGGATAIIQNRDDGSWTRVASSGHGEKWSQYGYILMVKLIGLANGKYMLWG